MPNLLSRVFTRKTQASSKNSPVTSLESGLKPQHRGDAWARTEVLPEEVQELLKGCTQEIKSRGISTPFLLLPFRPTADPSGARTFIRNFFNPGSGAMRGEFLMQELRLTELMVLCSILKWCWARIPGGVVSWESYDLFKVGEQDSNMARDAFTTFIPISAGSEARTSIIFDFFDLMASVAAHGKHNGFGGRKLSRLAGWWAFDHTDDGIGFEGGYRSWAKAADATSHLFFAYLRSLSPDSIKGINGISTLPISLQSLLQSTEYPPETPTLLQSEATRVHMTVNSVSPTPFALLRRAKHFDYRDDDRVLNALASYDDPVQALSDECLRVLKCISSTNERKPTSSQTATGVPDASWSRFQDMGFLDNASDNQLPDAFGSSRGRSADGLLGPPRRQDDAGRPTTPSWADFLSTGFADEPHRDKPSPFLLPPDSVLPPIDTNRARTSRSENIDLADDDLEPGEIAAVSKMDVDAAFWWVWITSLASEETPARKAAFGRCALLETSIKGGQWMVVEEKVKGAAAAPIEGAHIVEKKSRFAFLRRKKTTKTIQSKTAEQKSITPSATKHTLGPDHHARIQSAAADLQRKQRLQQFNAAREKHEAALGKNREDGKTNSGVFLPPIIVNEAIPAMQWATKFDKDSARDRYMSDPSAGKGLPPDPHPYGNGSANGSANVLTNGADRVNAPLPKEPEAEKPVPPTPPKDNADAGSDQVVATPPLPAKSMERLPRPDEVPDPLPSRVSTPPAEEPVLEKKVSAKPEPAVQPARTASYPSPEVTADKNKLKKRATGSQPSSGGGFKKLFGRKKDKAEKQERPAISTPVSSNVEAQAASKGFRLSDLKKTSTGSTASSPREDPHRLSYRAVSMDSVVSPPPQLRREAIEPTGNSTPESVSVRTSHEEQAAVTAFSQFDQGPLDDMPAFVPEESDNESVKEAPRNPEPQRAPEPARAPEPVRRPEAVRAPETMRRIVEPARAPEPVQRAPEPVRQAIPVPAGPPAPSPVIKTKPADSKIPPKAVPVRSAPPRDDESERSVSPPPIYRDRNARQEALKQSQKPAPSAPKSNGAANGGANGAATVDRWAQIRKNAAERVAKRSEEHPRRSTGTDESDTGGEETIESRVARIKARVAELTGGMEEKQ